jgi:allantoinase
VKLLVHGGTVVGVGGRARAEVLCEDGLVGALLAPGERPAADQVIDASGRLVFPGFIDPHVHSRDPGLKNKETFATVTAAAAAGGITCLFDMPNTVPPLSEASQVEERARLHERTAHVDFGMWGVALGAANLDHLGPMLAAGVVAIKLFWGYSLDRTTMKLMYASGDADADQLVGPPESDEVLEIFAAVARAGGLLGVHCEDHALIAGRERALGRPVESYDELLQTHPWEAEAAAIAVALEFSAATGCDLHVVHVTSTRGAALVRAAHAAGHTVTAETCPHYLTLSSDDYERVGAKMKIFPPIRRPADREALWGAVDDGTVTSLGSDHAPHTLAEMALPLGAKPAGFAGVQTLAPLMVDAMSRGLLGAERLAWLLSEGTARRFGVYPRKGSLLPGTDADITIVDPDARWRVESDWLRSLNPVTPYAGRELRGRPVATIVRGRPVMEDDVVDDGAGGYGRFVPGGVYGR